MMLKSAGRFIFMKYNIAAMGFPSGNWQYEPLWSNKQ